MIPEPGHLAHYLGFDDPPLSANDEHTAGERFPITPA